MSDYESLSYFYEEIHQCHICPNMDREKELRKLEAIDLKADVFIVSQSLAENQLRKSVCKPGEILSVFYLKKMSCST
jgi:hypothetical protein